MSAPTTPPLAPGEVLRDLLDRMPDVTQEKLASTMKVGRFTVNQIINERRAVTPEMALRLSRALGTSAELWLNLQRNADLFAAQRKLGDSLDQIKPLRRAAPVVDQFVDR